MLRFVQAELAGSACVLQCKYTERITDRNCELSMSPKYHPSTVVNELSFPYYNERKFSGGTTLSSKHSKLFSRPTWPMLQHREIKAARGIKVP